MPETLFLPLTNRQRTILDFVVAFLHEKRYPPTISEIQTGASLGNPGLVFKVLQALEEKGYIARIKGKHRSARLTTLGAEFIESLRRLDRQI